MNKEQKPEALRLAETLSNAYDFADDIDHNDLQLAAMELESLHARVQELEKDLNGAKRLVSKVWNQHPEAREDIEEGTGVWMVFGQDVEASMSAQRVTG